FFRSIASIFRTAIISTIKLGRTDMLSIMSLPPRTWHRERLPIAVKRPNASCSLEWSVREAGAHGHCIASWHSEPGLLKPALTITRVAAAQGNARLTNELLR